jgi:multidrug efflux system outer membrane protein
VGEVPFLDLDADRAVEVALAQNLDLRVSTLNVEQAQWDHVNAKHVMLPSLSATAATGVLGQDETAGGAWGSMVQDAFPYLSLQGTFSVPLGNRAARGSARSALADLRSRELGHEELKRSVRAAVHQQVRVLLSSRQQVELADANLRLAQETLAAEEALFDAGRTILKDVLEARTAVDQARSESVRSRTAYRQGEVELLRLQGQLEAGSR